MKYVLYVILLLILSISCETSRKTFLAHHLDQKVEARKFVDSLTSIGIDSIIIYSDACSGCIPGTLNPIFTFWVEMGETYVTKFTEISNYNTIKPTDFSLEFFIDNAEKIESDSIVAPAFGLLHYHYESVNIIIKEYKYDFTISQFEKAQNQTNFKILAIDKIRAALFEIPYWEWVMQNYKTEKYDSFE